MSKNELKPKKEDINIPLKEIKYNKWVILYFPNKKESHQKTLMLDNRIEVNERIEELLSFGINRKEIIIFSPLGKVFSPKKSYSEKVYSFFNKLRKIEYLVNNKGLIDHLNLDDKEIEEVLEKIDISLEKLLKNNKK